MEVCIIKVTNFLDNVEKAILLSMYENSSMEKIDTDLKILMDLEKILKNFEDITIFNAENMDDIVYKIEENKLNLQILKKERIGYSCESEIKKMKNLWMNGGNLK